MSAHRIASLAAGLALLLAGAASAQYEDPWGLPSGSATLQLATQAEIATGAVQAFDFALGGADVYGNYGQVVSLGIADLLFVELVEGEASHWFRAPEDLNFFDRELIFALEDSLDIGEIVGLRDEQGAEPAWERFAAVEPGFAYLLLQIQAGASPETTAVKLEITAVGAESVEFDWSWQPNGSDNFVPTPVSRSSLGAVKAIYSR